MSTNKLIKPIQPSILVARHSLCGSVFEHSVVLLLEHNMDGAVGFVVNKPVSNMDLADYLFIENLEIPKDIQIWVGGPLVLETARILNMHDFTAGDEDEKSSFVLSETKVASKSEISKRLLVDLIEDCTAKSIAAGKRKYLYPYRFIIGHASWAPGQLEEELRQSAWLQLDFNEKLIFDTPWQEMWDLGMRSLPVEGIDSGFMIPDNPQQYLN